MHNLYSRKALQFMNKRMLLMISSLLLILTACAPSEGADPTVESSEAVESVNESDSPSEEEGVRHFVVVAEESRASYTVEEEFLAGALDPLGIEAGFNTAFGWTRTMEGEMQLDTSQNPPEVGENMFVVVIRTLSSDQDRRDEMIQRRFLESNLFPNAEFVINAIEDFPSEWAEGESLAFVLVGDLTIREITQEYRFDTEAVLDGSRLSGVASTSLTMTDFGFDPPSIGGILTVSDPALIRFEFVMEDSANSEE